MDPIVVALDVAPLHGHRTGVGTAVHHLVNELDRRDDVVTMPYVSSFRARPVPPQRRLPLPAAITSRIWMYSDHPRVDRWIDGAQVLHGTNYVAPPTRRPCVISVYDCWFLVHSDQASPSVRRSAAVLRRAVARGALVHASSHATAAMAADLLDTDRVAVVYLGPPDVPADVPGEKPVEVPVEVPATKVIDGRPFVLFVGTVERRKDVASLVQAFGRVAASDPDLQLVIAGAPGDDMERLTAATTELESGARDRVHVLGVVDQSTKQALLASARLLAYPSLDEGFGFPILEAQQALLPVVARGAGSIPEVGGEGVELVDPGSIEALAHGIDRVLTDGHRRAALVAAGIANLERFSWATTADQMITLYRRAMLEQG